LGDVLLTDRAVFMPIEYQDLDREFHPYTVARSMKHGWRWITPTFSRIGSGYAFSSRHCSDDEAVAEFLADAGVTDREPFVVDFKPRTVKKAYHRTHCFLGMAGGFMGPLDAPGLDLTVNNIMQIGEYLSWSPEQRQQSLDRANHSFREHVEWYSAFILAQYKHSTRSDTAFWQDQKAVACEWYDRIMANIDDLSRVSSNHHMMFYQTISARDVQWTVSPELQDLPLIPISEIELPTLHHRDFVEDIRRRYEEKQ